VRTRQKWRNYEEAAPEAATAEVSAVMAESVMAASGAASELAAAESVVAAGFEQAATDRAATAAAATSAVRTILEVMVPILVLKPERRTRPYAHIALIPKTPESRKGLFHKPVIAFPVFPDFFAGYDEITPQNG
jgi:hypothetical protein